MSTENIAIVDRAIRHLNDTGEPDWQLYDPELVWTTRRDGIEQHSSRQEALDAAGVSDPLGAGLSR